MKIMIRAIVSISVIKAIRYNLSLRVVTPAMIRKRNKVAEVFARLTAATFWRLATMSNLMMVARLEADR